VLTRLLTTLHVLSLSSVLDLSLDGSFAGTDDRSNTRPSRNWRSTCDGSLKIDDFPETMLLPSSPRSPLAIHYQQHVTMSLPTTQPWSDEDVDPQGECIGTIVRYTTGLGTIVKKDTDQITDQYVPFHLPTSFNTSHDACTPSTLLSFDSPWNTSLRFRSLPINQRVGTTISSYYSPSTVTLQPLLSSSLRSTINPTINNHTPTTMQ
jgi:hypothetical protein